MFAALRNQPANRPGTGGEKFEKYSYRYFFFMLFKKYQWHSIDTGKAGHIGYPF